ncbi:MAG: carboxymuconolactone decarboxylase family protein [Dehalococcoidia bacterium]
MARIPYLEESTGSPEAVSEWQRMQGARGGGRLPNLYKLLGHSPKLMARWAAFAETLRGYDQDGSVTLDARSRELAIIEVARVTGADYEWAAHLPIAQREGVTDEQVTGLLRDDLKAFAEADRALIKYAAELTRDVKVKDATFTELKRHFDERRILELTMTIGFYNCVARVLQGLAIDLEPGMQPIPR